MANLTVNGKEYALDTLSDNARSQLESLKFAEQKINQLQAEQAVTQTARNVYAQALAGQLPEAMAEGDVVEGDTITINEVKYSLARFSDEAKSKLASLRLTDQKLSQLQVDLAIAKTARSAYTQALGADLPA